MLRNLSRLAGLVLIAVLPCAAWAEEEEEDELPEEVSGAHDHPAVKRFPGSVITEFEEKEQETLQLPISDTETRAVEGRYFHAQYHFPAKASCAQVLATFGKTFKSRGLTVRSGNKRPAELASVGERWVSAEGRLDRQGAQVFIVQTCGDDPSYHAGDLFVLEAAEAPAAGPSSAPATSGSERQSQGEKSR